MAVTERHLPMDINYRKKEFENDVRRYDHLVAWRDMDRLVAVMGNMDCWDTIVTVVE